MSALRVVNSANRVTIAAGRLEATWAGVLSSKAPSRDLARLLLIAYLNIDDVIKIIRENDDPKPVLMKIYRLSDAQAEAILQLRLRHLARLEEMKITAEYFIQEVCP